METFVVRVFVPTDDAELEPAGLVEHVGTRRMDTFRGANGLVEAVLGALGAERASERDEEKEER